VVALLVPQVAVRRGIDEDGGGFPMTLRLLLPPRDTTGQEVSTTVSGRWRHIGRERGRRK